MKKLSPLILMMLLSMFSIFTVQAQTPESIWIQANTTTFKTNETVTVTINGASATPIQGFTAQIRYDPSCLQPENGTSPIPGMNGLAVPQLAGLADVSFASTTPQMANGVLAELRFEALKGCQTNLVIESAALVFRSDAGLAVPISGINIDQAPLALTIDSAEGVPQPQASGESVLLLAPASTPASHPINWRMVGSLSVMAILIVFILGLFTVLKPSEA